MENGERGESRGIVKTAQRILVVMSAKQRPLGRIFSTHSPSIRLGRRQTPILHALSLEKTDPDTVRTKMMWQSTTKGFVRMKTTMSLLRRLLLV